MQVGREISSIFIIRKPHCVTNCYASKIIINNEQRKPSIDLMSPWAYKQIY